jgi:hypothetical protein
MFCGDHLRLLWEENTAATRIKNLYKAVRDFPVFINEPSG